MGRRLRESWSDRARQRSIQTRQQQAQLKKTGFYITKATGDQVPGFSGRAGFVTSENPLTVAAPLNKQEQ